uniref:Uncharacterized protein n=1 Tax=Ditylenchus dipsaci TaxID=166011 RepID=A0A915E640_9BILA
MMSSTGFSPSLVRMDNRPWSKPKITLINPATPVESGEPCTADTLSRLGTVTLGTLGTVTAGWLGTAGTVTPGKA